MPILKVKSKEKPPKRQRGRPKAGDRVVNMVFPDRTVKRAELWAARQEPPVKLAEALRRLVDYGLRAQRVEDVE
jgi:hypothetical protein